MKTVVYALLITALSILPQSLRAQQDRSQTSFGKGTKQITGSYGYSQGELLQNRDVISVRLGYYVADRLSVGVISSLSKEWWGDIHTTNFFSAGPFIRYQFLDRRLSPFVEVAYQYGRPNFMIKQAAFFTPGVNFRLFSQVRLEASYGLLLIPSGEQIGQAQLGATVLLGKNRRR